MQCVLSCFWAPGGKLTVPLVTACVFGRITLATIWTKTTTILTSIPSRLLARLSEPWSAPPTAFTFAVNKAKIIEKRRALRLRFSKSRKYIKHGINLSLKNPSSSLDEEYWDALKIFQDAQLNDSNGSPGTAYPVFGPPVVSCALGIAQSFDMSDFAASPSPYPIAADDKDASPTNTSFEPSLFNQNAFASTQADASLSSSLVLPSPLSSPASPPTVTCEDIKAPSEALPGSEPQATAEVSALDLQPVVGSDPAVKPYGAPAPFESPAKSGTPDEPKSEPEPVDKPNSSAKPPPKFKLPVKFSLSRSSARFKLKGAPQPKSLKQLPIQPQLYPRVKPCCYECDLDVAALTSLLGQLKLDSSKPGSPAEQTSNGTKAPAGKRKAASTSTSVDASLSSSLDVKTPSEVLSGSEPQVTAKEPTVGLHPAVDSNPIIKLDVPSSESSVIKSEALVETKPALEHRLANKLKSFVKPLSLAPPNFKLPIKFSLARSSARFQLQDAPKPKSLNELLIQPQRYPEVKACSREYSCDVAPLTSLFNQLKLRSSNPKSTTKRTPNTMETPMEKKKMTKTRPSNVVVDGIRCAKDTIKKMEKQVKAVKNKKKASTPNVEVPAKDMVDTPTRNFVDNTT
ncbi:hypothetical protein FRC07_006387, partial [Ceratobasidium sp. 392]